MIERHRILNCVADLVDQGRLRATATKTLTSISPDAIREAHELAKSGRTIGKVIIHGWE